MKQNNKVINRQYEFLPHTADLKIKSQGKTYEELFANSMRGMIEWQKPKILKEKVTREITVSSSDCVALLVDFLSETLYLSKTNLETYAEVEFLEFFKTSLKAILRGRKVSKWDDEIKAVTFHELEIKKNNKGLYEATITYDI